MGEKDLSEKLLLDYPDVFADIVNGLLFKGQQKLNPQEMKATGTASQYKVDAGNLHEQSRDVAKTWNVGGVCYCLFGIENQTVVDKDMVLRVLNYDGMSYRSQLLAKIPNPKTGDMMADPHRYPVITLVLNFSDKRWTQPKSIYEFFDIDEEMRQYVSDYRINVFDIAYLSDEEISYFHSDFQSIARKFVAMHRGNTEIKDTHSWDHVDEMLKFLSAMSHDEQYLDVQLDSKERKGGVNMDVVLNKMIQKGFMQGREEGSAEKTVEVFINCLNRGMSCNDAISIAVIDEAEAQKLYEKWLRDQKK